MYFPEFFSIMLKTNESDRREFPLTYSGDRLTTGQPPSTELPTYQSSVQQAAPPADSEPQPEVIFPASAVVSFSLDECPPSVEQSVRVEPSPERIYALPSCAEEDETMSPLSASSSKYPMQARGLICHKYFC